MQRNYGGSNRYEENQTEFDFGLLQTLKTEVIDKVFNPKNRVQMEKDLIAKIKIVGGAIQHRYYHIYEFETEQREIGEETVPSDFLRGTLPEPASARSIRVWELEVPEEYVKEGSGQKHVLPGTQCLADCRTCGTNGKITCDCGNGKQACPNCGGNGNIECSECRGSGEVCCFACNGSGEQWESRYAGDDEDGNAVYEEYSVPCYNCRGLGRVECTSCRGSRVETCGTCMGSGIITCQKCGGTMQVTCRSCKGKGYFVNQLYLQRSFDRHWLYCPQEFRDAYPDRFDKQLKEIEDDSKDTTVLEVLSEEIIEAIKDPNGETIPTRYLYDEIIKNWQLPIGSRIIRHSVKIRERRVYDVIYRIGDKEYKLRYDPVTKQTIFDRYPFTDYKKELNADLESNFRNHKYRSFVKNLDDYSNSLKYNEAASENVRSMIKKADVRFSIIGAIPSILVLAASMIVFRFRGLVTVLSFVAQAAIGVLIGRFLWEKLASDRKLMTEAKIIVLGLIIGIVIRFVLKFG